MKRTPLKRRTPLRAKTSLRSSKRPSKQRKGKERILTLSKLKKKAWSVFSKWIRQRDNWTCYTCGKRMENSPAMHAGHFITRVRQSTMFDEMNVHAQCMMCNMFRNGESGIYAIKLLNQYGKGEFEKLFKRSRQLKQFTRQELEEIIERYKL